MKAQKIIAGVFALTLFASAAFSVSAAKESRDLKNQNMQEDFSKLTNNGVGYMYYHVGSVRPYDDVFAYSETKVTSGMEGYAYVEVTGIDGKTVWRATRKIVDDSYIRTENAVVGGCDVAKKVVFRGGRKQKNTGDWHEFDYIIH